MKIKLEFITSILFLLTGIILLINSSLNFQSKPEVVYILKDTVQIYNAKDTLNSKNVYKEILKDSIQYPLIVFQQVLMETGYLTSNVCKNRCNLFGFSDNAGYLKFDSWQQSIRYYKDWQNRYYSGKGSYYEFLRKYSYAQDTTYVNKIKRINVDKWLK